MKAVFAAALLLPAIASADVVLVTGAPGSGQTAAQPFVPATAPKPKKSGLDERQDIVATNRGIVAPTALTVPAGKVEVTLQSLVPFAGLAGLNAGITSTTEVWIEGAAALAEVDDDAHEVGAGIKQMIVHTDRLAIAVSGSMRKFGEGEKLMSIGGIGTLCVDEGCGLQISGSLSRIWGFHESDYDENGPGENLITLSASMGNATTRAMVETMTVEGDSILFAGVRFGSRTYAVDLALVTPLDSHGDDIPALPWFGFSARL